MSSRDTTPQIYAMPTDGGEAEAVTSLPQGVMDFVVTSTGNLVFTMTSKVLKKRSEDEHARIDRAWYRFDPAPGYLEDHNHTLFVAKPGGKPRALSDGMGMVMGMSVTADGKRAAYRVMGLKKHKFVEVDVMTCSLTGKPNNRCVLENTVTSQVKWHSDGETLFASTTETVPATWLPCPP
jgi:hypothetical protein